MTLLVRDQEDTLFRSYALHFIVLDDELLLQHFDGVQLFGRLCLGQHDFTEVTLTEHCEEVEVVETDASPRALRVGWRRLLALFGYRLCDGSRRTRLLLVLR